MTKTTAAGPYSTGWCRAGNHHVCRGGVDTPSGRLACACVCHAEPEPKPEGLGLGVHPTTPEEDSAALDAAIATAEEAIAATLASFIPMSPQLAGDMGFDDAAPLTAEGLAAAGKYVVLPPWAGPVDPAHWQHPDAYDLDDLAGLTAALVARHGYGPTLQAVMRAGTARG